MRAIQVSDELYEKLKGYVVDPFDDTPEHVIGRLIDIADKAKNLWSSWEPSEGDPDQQSEGETAQPAQGRSWQRQADPVM